MTTDEALNQRFAPVFERIAAGALEREAERRLPFPEVEWLRAAGFGRIRVPAEDGGLGATLPQFFRQLVALGRADSNLPQLLRGHIGFVESRLGHADPDVRKRWLRRVVDGALVGNAQSEDGSPSFWQNATTVRRDGHGWRLDGRKFYSTGSLFADWILTTATIDSAPDLPQHSATVLVPTDAPGVRRIDDWDGFGQRLTGSGTTIFDAVPIADEDVEPYENGTSGPSRQLAVYQLVHLATLAGIGQAAVAEAVAFVNQRTRNLANPTQPSPRLDPQVQQVIGRLESKSFAATATALAAADVVERAVSDAADAAVFAAQTAVIELVLGLTTELFEVGGASAVTDRFQLDRHWRNARTLASHNPAITRQTILGDHLLNGTSPSTWVQRVWTGVQE
jgi:alkylation response protein AidB-like acyl-CoA dehydrogenase